MNGIQRRSNYEKLNQTSIWSEEDENAINDIMWIIEAYRENSFNEIHKQTANNAERWLKSLRPQNTWKPNDAQMIVLNEIITNGHLSNANERILKGLQEQLKKLK